MGVEVYNLGADSVLRAFPKVPPEEFARGATDSGCVPSQFDGAKTFLVNYRFLSCGEVFSDGLANAARGLGLRWESAYWDDAGLALKAERFGTDLVFVVHGRRYAQRWDARPSHGRTAVWLLDDPYEVAVFEERLEHRHSSDSGLRTDRLGGRELAHIQRLSLVDPRSRDPRRNGLV